MQQQNSWKIFLALILIAISNLSLAIGNFQSVPGGIAGVLLDEETESTVIATFGNTRIPVVPYQQRWVALAPLDWDTLPGFYIVSTLSEDSDYRSYTFSVKSGERPLYNITDSDSLLGKETPLTLPDDLEVSVVDGEVNNPDLNLMLPVDTPILKHYGKIFLQQQSIIRPFPGIRFDLMEAETLVIAPVFGRVVDIQPLGKSNWQATIDHGNGLVSIFRELSALSVNVDDWVSKGSDVGMLAKTLGTEFLPHWSLYMNGAWIDPMILVSSEVDLAVPEQVLHNGNDSLNN